ncbi:hypothetical protein FRC15_007567 [Serendipita sp. 397]|nr:hypothetical protein FRC15_007567 [Serendipita sp. 397]
MEQEARLKKQVYAIWKTWKESGQSDQLPSSSATSAVDSISGITDPRPAIKKHTSSSSTSSDASSRTRAIIRTFEEEPASPRPVQRPTNIIPNASSPNTVPYSSSMSPSNATPRVRPTMSALGTSLRQSTMHYPQKPPSPPLAGADEENFDMEFDDVVSGRERPQTRKAAASPPTHTSDNAPNRHQKPKASAMKRVSMDATKSKPMTIDSSSDLSTEGSVSTEGQTGRRKAVKFSNDQPDVVTVTREIESEKLQKLQEEQARGEEAIFDLDDGDEEGDSTRTGDKRVKSSPPAVAPKEESIDPLQPITSPVQEPESPRAKFSFPRLSQVGNEKTRNIEYTLAKSLPTTSTLANLANRSAGGAGSLGLDVESRMDQVASTSRAGSGQQTQKPGSASPYGGELRKIMASQTPTHRSPWLAKRPTGRHTTREPSMSDEDEDGNEEEEEDYDDEDTEGSDDGESKVKNDFVPSSSVPLPIPRMSKVIESKSQAAVAADNDFAGAMSKSVDPGPALELLALENGRASRRGPEEEEDEDEDEDEERGEERQRKRDRDEEEAANEEEARDLMNRMIEGRGSLYAQRILSQTDRGVPASMWRSMA